MEKYLNELKEKLDQVLFDNDDWNVRFGFNRGARTMFNYAYCIILEIGREVKGGERMADSSNVGEGHSQPVGGTQCS